jgi:hypothetical protein
VPKLFSPTVAAQRGVLVYTGFERIVAVVSMEMAPASFARPNRLKPVPAIHGHGAVQYGLLNRAQ